MDSHGIILPLVLSRAEPGSRLWAPQRASGFISVSEITCLYAVIPDYLFIQNLKPPRWYASRHPADFLMISTAHTPSESTEKVVRRPVFHDLDWKETRRTARCVRISKSVPTTLQFYWTFLNSLAHRIDTVEVCDVR